MTLDELQTQYNRLSKSWRTLSRADKTIAFRQLEQWETDARGLHTDEGDAVAEQIHGLALRVHAETQPPVANEDPGLEY